MAESRLIQKQLAGKEDLLLGVGTVSQARATGVKTITKLNATHFGGVLVVDTINDLNSLDKNQLDEQVVLVKEDECIYIYNGTSWVTKTTITEYGIFTPVLKDAPTGNSATAQISTGRYTKIGNRVFFDINLINITTTGLTPESPVFITGLPYTSINYAATALSPCKVIGSLVASTTGISASPIAGQSYLALYNESETGYGELLISAITSGTGNLAISGSYEVSF